MKTTTSAFGRRILAVMTACALVPSAFAATVSINPTTAFGTPGAGTDPTPIGIQFGGDGVTVGFQADVAFDNTLLTVTLAGQNGGSCSNNIAGIVRVLRADPDLAPLPAGPTTYCAMTFTVSGTVPVPGQGDPDVVFPLTVQNALFSDANADPSAGPHVLTNGAIVVTGTPDDVTLSYTPAPNSTITFGGGTQGDVVSQSITVDANGLAGTGEVTSCALGGANPGAFSIAGNAFPIQVAAPAGTDTIDIDCTLGAAASTATLTCVENDTVSTNVNRAWSLSCPVGAVPNVAPTIVSSVPAAGGTVTVPAGSAGAQSTSTIVFNATGGSGVGPAATTNINCVAVAPVTVSPVPLTVVGSQATANLTVQVGLTAAPATYANAITCTAGGFSGTYSVQAPAGSTFTPPEVIPSASTWSKIALFGLLGMFGLMAVGFRRQG